MRGAVARLPVEFVMTDLPSDNYMAVPIPALNIWDLPLRQEPRPTFRTIAAWRWTNRSRARPYAILGDLTGWSFSICCLRPSFGRGSCPNPLC